MSGSQGLRTVGAVWRDIQNRLEQGRDVAPGEARQMVRAVLDVDETALVLREDSPFPAEHMARLEEMARRRMDGEPLAQVLGFAWFYGRRWMVTRDVLIPRPDTEILVNEVLGRLEAGAKVAEVGVGSGCIMGTLLAERRDIEAVGVEISEAAALVARENIGAMGLAPERWSVVLRDGLDGIEGPFDVIVSNPPYVTDSEWEALESEVRDFEPRLALTGGAPNPDGLVFYRRLAEWGRTKLRKDGWLCMETGWQQAQAVRKLLEEQGELWCEISVTKDLGERERAVCARRC